MIKLKSLIIEGNDIRVKTEMLRNELLKKFPELEDLEFNIPGYRDDLLELRLIRIWQEHRGKGVGRQVIDTIKKFADENGLVINLSPEPMRGYKKKLDKFYKSLDFVDNKGRNRDYRLSSPFGRTMYRRPIK